jgi:hypothetical protein
MPAVPSVAVGWASGSATSRGAARYPNAATGLLGLAECRFEFGSLLSHPPRLLADGTVADGHDRWDVERAGLPAEVELRVAGNGRYYGRFMTKPGPDAKPSLQPRLVAVNLADQAARAFAAHEPARSTS